jgi:hypothetical protein
MAIATLFNTMFVSALQDAQLVLKRVVIAMEVQTSRCT